MLATLLRRFATREAVMSTAAQLALTWGANHLATVIADQEEQIRLLEVARDGYAADAVRIAAERDELLGVVKDYAPADILSGGRFDRSDYPTAQDTDPLERAHSDLETALNTPEG